MTDHNKAVVIMYKNKKGISSVKNAISNLLPVLFALFFCLTAVDGHVVNREVQLSGLGLHASENNASVGVDEKTGRKIAMEAIFTDEHGRRVTPGSFIDRAVIILPVFYTCTQSCGMMLGSLATALNKVPLVPGRDYRVLALSIDDEDNMASAKLSKENYFKLLKKEFPQNDWLFLTGDKKNIKLFTDSIGFSFRRVSVHNFTHPNVMVIVSRDGTIIRYMYGPVFLPFDISMALTEASRGTPAISIRKVLSYCFTYDPERKTYTLTIVRYIVAGILGLIGIFLFILLKKKNTA